MEDNKSVEVTQNGKVVGHYVNGNIVFNDTPEAQKVKSELLNGHVIGISSRKIGEVIEDNIVVEKEDIEHAIIEQIKFIPVSLEEAIDYLIKENEANLDSVKKMTESKFLGVTHHGLGQFIRNEWNLWWHPNHGYKEWPKEESPLNAWFRELNIFHADDKSSIILTCTHRKLMGIDYDIPGQIEKFKAHWKKNGFEDGIFKYEKE